MSEQSDFSIDQISDIGWKLYRPNGECRSPLVFLRRGGKVAGYNHPNEARWVRQGEGFAFVAQDGRVTSISKQVCRNQAGLLEIRMFQPGTPEQLAHILVETKSANDEKRSSGQADLSKKAAAVMPESKDRTANITVGLTIPDAACTFLRPEISRVLFIANNPDIDPAIFHEWLPSASDAVVQYNLPLFFDEFANSHSHKVHFLYPNGKSCWGFSDDANPEREYLQQKHSSLTFAIAHWIPSAVEDYLRDLDGQAQYMAMRPDMLSALYNYPEGGAPSCGFLSISFFRFMNLIRRCQGTPPLELVMIGFTGRYAPGKAWPGHDFSFEQQVYDTWLDLKRISADGSGPL